SLRRRRPRAGSDIQGCRAPIAWSDSRPRSPGHQQTPENRVTPSRSRDPPQLLPHNLLKPRTLIELREQLTRQPLDLLINRLTVVLELRRSDIPPGRQPIISSLNLG